MLPALDRNSPKRKDRKTVSELNVFSSKEGRLSSVEASQRPQSCGEVSSHSMKDGEEVKHDDQWIQEPLPDAQGTSFFSQVKCPSSIEQVILAFKAEATRRLKPALLKSVKLKSQASPSVKQFLEIYDKPTAVDKFTGKPIPLRQVYHHEMVKRKREGTTLAVMTKAMGTIARQTELRGSIGLARVDPYQNTLTEKDGFWSRDMPEYVRSRPMTVSDLSVSLPSKKSSPEFRRVDESKCVKWTRLPVYLTAAGEVKGSSLGTIGNDMMYCGPSQHTVTHPPTTRKTTSRSQTHSSFFVTQNQTSASSNTPCPSTRRRKSDRARTRRLDSARTLQLRGWEPLTKSALLEHTRVFEVEIPTEAQTPPTPCEMWKPRNSRVTSSKAKSPLENSADIFKHYNTIGYSDASNHFYSKYSSLYSEFFGFPTKV